MERLTGVAPEHICALLRRDCIGLVEMVNSRGIYLQLQGRHILLCHRDYGTVPNGIALDGWERLPALLTAGESVRLEKGVLYAPSAAWELALVSIPKDINIRFPHKQNLVDGIRVLEANAKQTGLSSLVYPLFMGQTPEMNLFCRMALPLVKALLQALEAADTAAIKASVSSLLGLGPGLTPSADDLLCGLVYGLRHSSFRDTAACKALCDAIHEQAAQRTNGVSADCLLALTEDAAFDCLAAAWKDPATGAAALVGIGSNSGGEMLLGLLCAAAVVPALAKKCGK